MQKDLKTKSHRDLIVWQKAMLLVKEIYRASSRFPEDERFGLTSQVRRAAVSIPSNIAEGRARSTKKDYLHFLHIALGSSAELETQLEIARELSFLSDSEHTTTLRALEEVRRMLIAMMVKMKAFPMSQSSKLKAQSFSQNHA